MACRAGAALHREPHRLVEHQHVVVLVERDRLEERAGLLSASLRGVARLRRIELERRDAHRLPGLQPVLRLGALAVHPQLAFADDALDMGERQPRKAGLEEAVDAHAGFVAGHGDGLHAGLAIVLTARSAQLLGCRAGAPQSNTSRSPRICSRIGIMLTHRPRPSSGALDVPGVARPR